MKDESLYEQIASELVAGQQRPGIWLKALTDANGNETLAKLEYTRLRLADLKSPSSVAPNSGLAVKSWCLAALRRWPLLRPSARSLYAKLMWTSAGLIAVGFLGMLGVEIFGGHIEGSSSFSWFGFLAMNGMVLGAGTAIVWLVSRTKRGWRRFAWSAIGTLLGFGLGFALVFAAFLSNPGHRYGEMAGVAGLGYGLIFGGPAGALAGCLVGLWIGLKQTRSN